MHKVALLVACFASNGLGQSTQSWTRQLPERADANSRLPTEAAAGALIPLKAAAMLIYALAPGSVFVPSGNYVQVDNPTFAGHGLVASGLRSQVLPGTGRSGTSALAIIGDLLAEQKQPQNQIDEINVPKKKKKKVNKGREVMEWIQKREMQTSEFVGGYMIPQDMPKAASRPGIPEVTFAGRSNVGKSSALNVLLGRTKNKIAKTSKTPGRTRQINLFHIGRSCSITDLPGYGYAKVNKEMKQKWQSGLAAYFRYRENLKACVLLVDARVEPQETDARFLDFLEAENVSTIVLATKMDKIPATARKQVLHRLYDSLALPEGQPIPFSGKTGEGKTQVWKAIAERCLYLRDRPVKEQSDEQGDPRLDLWR